MPLTFPFGSRPSGREPVEVAPGFLWFTLPLPMALDHVNIYAIHDTDGWTLIDTGLHTPETEVLLEDIIRHHLAPAPIARVLLTHFHPDHVGMAGWLKTHHGAEIMASRTTWLMVRMLTLDVQPRPVAETLQFYAQAGMDPERLEMLRTRRPFNFADCVHLLPPGYTRLEDGGTLTLGGQTWDIHMGNGHAPEHVTLWSREGTVVIGADQFLADITPNIGVHASEPAANPLAEWLASCRTFRARSDDHLLVLPGHKVPFHGLSTRLDAYAEFHRDCLAALTTYLATPRTTLACFEVLFGRRIPDAEFNLALAEATAHLNYLLAVGTITRAMAADGAWHWQANPTANDLTTRPRPTPNPSPPD